MDNRPVQKKQLKYLILTNHSYMLWQFRRELIRRLLEEGEVVISTPFVGHEHDFEEMGCRCIETQLERRAVDPVKDLKLYRFYNRILAEEKPDAVITYSIKPNIYGGYACSRRKIPYYCNVQGLGTAFQNKGITALVTGMYRIALKRANAVIFENKSNAKLFCRKKITDRNRAVVLSGAGVNLDYFAFTPWLNENEGIHFLFLGRIMKEKGVDELFDAFRRLKEEYGDRVILDLVGFFEDEYKETVQQLADSGTVVFHGFQEDPRPYYASAHCIVLPSYHEGMSNVLLEAAAMGRALITSDIPGCREAVREGKNGFLAQARDADSLYQCMRVFMELSPEARAEMGRNGRLHMERAFNRTDVVERVMRILHNIPRPE